MCPAWEAERHGWTWRDAAVESDGVAEGRAPSDAGVALLAAERARNVQDDGGSRSVDGAVA